VVYIMLGLHRLPCIQF